LVVDWHWLDVRRLKIGFFVQEQKAGDTADREEFSQEIFDRYDADIVAACNAAEPPLPDPSAEARALMAIMAEHAKGDRPQSGAPRMLSKPT
jgi:hypothetical protein